MFILTMKTSFAVKEHQFAERLELILMQEFVKKKEKKILW